MPPIVKPKSFPGTEHLPPLVKTLLDKVFPGDELPMDMAIPAAPLMAAAKSLPMDWASRMARAKDLGFTEDVFHGTKHRWKYGSKAKDIPEIDKTDFSKFKYHVDPRSDVGIHVATDPDTASRAIKKIHFRDEGSADINYPDGARVLPLKARIQNPVDIPDMGNWANPDSWLDKLNPGWRPTSQKDYVDTGNLSLDPDLLEELIKRARAEIMSRDAAAKGSMNISKHYDAAEKNWGEAIRNILTRRGHDAIRYKNVVEGKGEPSYMLLNPNQLRSRWAAFDPARAKSGDLLASLAAAVGLGAAAGGNDVE